MDGKVRSGKKGGLQEGTPLIVGWDAAGIVEETGPETSLFKKGDEIFFAGSINRPGMLLRHILVLITMGMLQNLSLTQTHLILGCNAEYTLVDERIVGRKPRRLSFLEAAGEPLTTLTAWEGLIDGIRIPVPKCMPIMPPPSRLINQITALKCIDIQGMKMNLTRIKCCSLQPVLEVWVPLPYRLPSVFSK